MSNNTRSTETAAPIVGTYRGRTIPAWLDFSERGGRHEYVGIAAEDRSGAISLDQLAPEEVVVYPGLIYRRMS